MPHDGAPIFAIRHLEVRFNTLDGIVEAVRGVNVDVKAGETVAIVGESGSGKSQLMMAAMGLLAANGEASGTVDYRGDNLLTLPKRALNEVRGRRITMIFQEPMTSLDPLWTIGNQLIEPIERHQRLDARAAREKAVELLRLVRIPHPERRLHSYPHELSGGQRQRVMIAMAIANDPDLLIADEPTTALDVTIQAEILDLLRDLQQRLGMSLVFITHDLGIVRRIADRVYVMKAGAVVEEGDTDQVFEHPRDPYTAALLAAEPEGRKVPVPRGSPSVLEGRKVTVEFELGGGFFRPPVLVLRAVDRVSLSLRRNETIGVVGESGSGKSTFARALLRLMPFWLVALINRSALVSVCRRNRLVLWAKFY
jgi:oligopeptide transport system ATP-binding protein